MKILVCGNFSLEISCSLLVLTMYTVMVKSRGDSPGNNKKYGNNTVTPWSVDLEWLVLGFEPPMCCCIFKTRTKYCGHYSWREIWPSNGTCKTNTMQLLVSTLCWETLFPHSLHFVIYTSSCRCNGSVVLTVIFQQAHAIANSCHVPQSNRVCAGVDDPDKHFADLITCNCVSNPTHIGGG